jgi:hypothetical protein
VNKKQKKLILGALWSHYNELDKMIEKEKNKIKTRELLKTKMETYDLIVKVRSELYRI